MRALTPYWLAGPALGLVAALVLLPLAMTLSLSFFPFDPAGGVKAGWTLENYESVAADGYFRTIFLRTFGLSAAVTIACIVIGFPEAYILTKLSPRWRAVSLVIVVGPLLISVVVRTLGWAILMGNEGIINRALLDSGVIATPIQLMFTMTGTVIALIHVLCPFMVLSVWASLQKLDPATEWAAESLGANAFTVLRRIVFPQAIPGTLSGALIIFALSASAFATPAIVGGRRIKVVATTIYDEFLGTLNWPLGAALAVILLIVIIASSVFAARLVERQFRQVFG